MGLLDRVKRMIGASPPAAALTAPKRFPGLPGPEGTGLVRHRPRVVYRGRDWETRKGITLRPEIATKLIWDPGDRERIIAACEAGDFRPLAFFLSALASDDTVQATMGHLCSLLRLPIQWTGDPLLIKTLQGSDPVFDAETLLELDPGHPSDFWTMHPYPELRRVLWDGRLGGLGLGEYVPQPQGPPRLQHLDLHGLRWDWASEMLSYHSVGAQYTVIAGDRRWLVFTPYGRRRWWDVAPWKACALPYIAKQGARLDRLRRQGDLANALHLVVANPSRQGAELDEFRRFVEDDWELDGYLVVESGEDAKLVESGGAGFEIFREGEEGADKAIAKTLSGQTVTSTGTTGMNNAGGIWDTISREIIEGFGETLADTLHEQCLRPYGKARGRSGLVWVHWDVRSPTQKVADAEAAAKVAEAAGKVNQTLQAYGQRLRLNEFFEAQGLGSVPIENLPSQPTQPTKAIAAGWEESKHPRADDGKFGSGGGGGDGKSQERDDARSRGIKDVHRERMIAGMVSKGQTLIEIEQRLGALADHAPATVNSVLDKYPCTVMMGQAIDSDGNSAQGLCYSEGGDDLVWMSDEPVEATGRGIDKIGNGIAWCVDDWASTPEEREAAILTHEIGHHLHAKVNPKQQWLIKRCWRRALNNNDSAPSIYALDNHREWFAEAFVLHSYAPDALKKRDPFGAKVVSDILSELK